MSDAELLQLQRKAERERIVDYEPEFALDAAGLDELSTTTGDVDGALRNPRRDLSDLAALLHAEDRLDDIAQAAKQLAEKRFGHTMHLFAPLYLSNECVSECTYCGFQVWNRDIKRRTLSPPEVATEARYLKQQGFRHVLLVSGEHPKHVDADYISDCVDVVAREVPQVSIEVQVWDQQTYERFTDAGADGLVVYQECYDERVYPQHHLKGNKRFFGWRLGAPERGAKAGFRRLGIGTLLGLNPNWRWEVLALAAHARFLMRHYWRCELTVALPRLEPAAGFDTPPTVISDREFVLAICALRLVLADAGIVLSTREPARLRDGLAPLGVTHMSAGSRTEPGGYTEPGAAEEQFRISDERPTGEVASCLVAAGFEPVWKDGSPALRGGDRL